MQIFNDTVGNFRHTSLQRYFSDRSKNTNDGNSIFFCFNKISISIDFYNFGTGCTFFYGENFMSFEDHTTYLFSNNDS